MKRALSKFAAIAAMATAVAVSAGTANAASANDVKISLNGETVTFDVKPQVIDGRTYVPFRALLEKMGANVEWDSEKKMAISTKDGVTVKIPLDGKVLTVQDHPLTMDVPTIMVDNRVLVPLRFVANALGATVNWDEAVRKIEVTQNANDQLSQFINGQDTGTVSYEQAAILFEWLTKAAENGNLPQFTGEKAPAKNPYTGEEWSYIPAPLKVKGVDSYFKAVQGKSGTSTLHFGVKRDVFAGKYRIVEQHMFNSNYDGVGYVVYDQTRGTFQWAWEGYDITAYFPQVN